MSERVLREIKITWWKKPQLEGYTITVPADADDTDINRKVQDFMNEEVVDTWDWEKGDFVKEDVIDLSLYGREP